MHAGLVRIGDRLRIVGTAEFVGLDRSLPDVRVNNLMNLMRQIYPDLADKLKDAPVDRWTNFRPMSADGLPYIGQGGVEGLWVNTGHGYLGWTMASGSAELLADLIDEVPTNIDPSAYRIGR